MKPKPQYIATEICPVCGKKDFSLFLKTKDYFLTREDFRLDQCYTCGFVFTNPVPTPDSLSKYYESPVYLSHTANSTSLIGQVYKLFRKANIKNKFNIVKAYSNGKSILDIGCGTGELLHYFQEKGWEVMGVEPNQSAREFAANTYQIKVSDENELDRFEANSMDVISMWHVLEHVPDLNSRIKQIKKLIKPGGLIVIALPNLDSPDALKYGPHWAGLDVPRHLYHFTKKTIQLLLQNHKLKVIESLPMKFDAYYVSLLSERYLNAHIPYFPAILNGYNSNRKAQKENNYSSMIYIVKEQ